MADDFYCCWCQTHRPNSEAVRMKGKNRDMCVGCRDKIESRPKPDAPLREGGKVTVEADRITRGDNKRRAYARNPGSFAGYVTRPRGGQ